MKFFAHTDAEYLTVKEVCKFNYPIALILRFVNFSFSLK
jgi:hypothetical protein